MNAKLAFISAHGSTYSIRLLCSVLGVARSWFHDWQAGDQDRTRRAAPKLTWSAQGPHSCVKWPFPHLGQKAGQA